MEDSMTEEDRKLELDRLRTLLRAREGKTGYGQNVEAIKARIAEIEGMTPTDG